MGVPLSRYDPRSSAELLKAAIFEQEANKRPGQTPSGLAQNAYISSIPNTAEQEREYQDVQEMDRGASARYEARQNQNNEIDQANAGSHAMGFENPRAQMEDAANKKLATILLPEQMKLRAAEQGADEARTYAAAEHEKDRASRADLVAAAQGGQTQRTTASLAQNDQHFQQAHPPGPIARLAEMFGRKPPSAVAPAAGSMEEPTVKIQDPNNGEVRDVPQSRARAVIARGGILIR